MPKEMFKDWDCVMVFDPEDNDQETTDEFNEYLIKNHSAVGDKDVPDVARTRKMLGGY